MHSNRYFETIKCKDQEVYNLEYHKKRVASTIGINIQLEEYIYPPSNELLKCKVIYDDTGILEITYTPYKKKELHNFKLISNDSITYSKKSTDRTILNELYSHKKNSDEIIIVKNNLITDTSIANIAVFHDENWITPKTPLLYGTTRQRYIDNGILKEKDISVDILLQANKIALLNAMIDFDIKTNFDIICD